jgi:hypothetical protein
MLHVAHINGNIEVKGMCIFISKRLRGKSDTMLAKTKPQLTVTTDIGTSAKKIGFTQHKVQYEIRKHGKDNLVISDKGIEVLTHHNIDQFRGKTVKIRFKGVPRARMGSIIHSIKSDNATVYVRAGKNAQAKAAPYYDVLIVEDKNEKVEG